MNSAATPPAPTNRSRSSQSSLRTSNSSSSSSSTTPSSSPSFIGRLDRTATDRRVSPTKQLVRSITQLVKRKTKTESLSNSGNSPPQASGVVLVNHSPTSSSTPALSLEKHSSSSSSLVANMTLVDPVVSPPSSSLSSPLVDEDSLDLGPIEQAQIAVSSNSATSPIPSSSSSFPSDEISVPPPVPPKSQSLENHIENHEEDESSTTANNSLTTLSSSTPIVITRSSPPPPPLKSASSHDHHQAAEIVEENDDDKPLGQHMQTLLPLPTKSSMKRTQFQQQHILLPQPTTTAATTTINTTASSSPPVIIDDDDDSFDFSDDLSEIPSIHVKFNELVAVHTIEHISYNDYDDDENDNMGGDYLRDTPRRSIWKRASVRIQKVFRTPSRKYSRCSGDDNDTDLGVADENVIHKNDGLEGRTGGGGGDAIIPVVLSQDTILETSSSSAVLASSSTNSSHGVTPQTHANDYNRRASLDVNNFDGYRAEVEIPEEEEDELDMAAATTNLPQKHYYRPSLDVSGISGREGIYDEVYDTAKTSAVKRTSLTHTLKRLMPTIRKRHSSSTTTSATANSTIEEMRVDPHTLLDLNFQVGSLLSNNLDSSTPSSSSYAVSSTPPVPSMPTTSLTTTNSMIDAKDFNDLYAQLVLGRRATTLEQTSRPLVRELSIRRTMLPEQRFSRVSFDLLSADDDIMLTLNYVESF